MHIVSPRSIYRARSLGRALTRDNMMTYDKATIDGTGAFLVGELERLDQKLHLPLQHTSYWRDIPIRQDVSVTDEVTSFTQDTFAAAGSVNAIGDSISFIGRNTSQIGNINIDTGKVVHPLHPWGLELEYTIRELMQAQALGRPVDQRKGEALRRKHQLDTDQMAYVGATSISAGGLVNNSLVTNEQSLPNGTAGASWLNNNKTPAQILADVNTALSSVWVQSALAAPPDTLGLPPEHYSYISTQLVSGNASMSILRYILENNLLTGLGGKLNIVPMKWLRGAGNGGTLGNVATVNRMVAYTRQEDFVRYPMTSLQRTPIQYAGLFQKTTYWGLLGELEIPYPDTIGYFDGL